MPLDIAIQSVKPSTVLFKALFTSLPQLICTALLGKRTFHMSVPSVPAMSFRALLQQRLKLTSFIKSLWSTFYFSQVEVVLPDCIPCQNENF